MLVYAIIAVARKSAQEFAKEPHFMEQIIHIESLTYGSAGIGRTDDGKAVFVDRAAPGDTVRVRIDEEKKGFSTGRIIELVEAGPSRVEPVCPHAATCGGCPWQHVSYEAQVAAKRANVVAALTRIAHFDESAAQAIVEDCKASKRQMGYRNKLELGAAADANGRLVLGMHRERSHELEAVQTCPLVHKAIANAPKAIQGALRYLEGGQGMDGGLGIYRVGIRTSVRTKSTELAIWTKPGPFPRAAAAKTLGSALHATSIVRVMADPGKSRAIKGVEALYGRGFWEEELCGIRYKVSAPSFFQVNTAQAETLVETALEGLDIDEDSRVADLYCGVGTFTLPLEERCGDVLAVESAASSVRDLRRNAEENGAWIDVIGGDSARELPQMGQLDALVVDPPRSGLAQGVAESIAAAAPKQVAYISCDPATWARDVARLKANGYALRRAVPVDLFPQTYHCELASIFERL
jgi:23S rRNA (uracil1939-C5)-methyltransferase